MAMPNISKMVILSILYNGSAMYNSDLKNELSYHRGYNISDGLLSTTITTLANDGYVAVTQKYSKDKKIIRAKVQITSSGKDYYKELKHKYIQEVNRINRAIDINSFNPHVK